MTIREENQKLIGLFEQCRVAAVREGMDSLGYHRYGAMDKRVRSLFPARAVGIARTVRYLPYEGPTPNCTGEDYSRWSEWYFREVCTEPWMDAVEPGDFVALDISGVDANLLGCSSALSARLRGAVGFVTNGGGIRDTDQFIMQEIPAWCMDVPGGADQTRVRYLEKDVPVAIGGVAVYPGDVIVADYDGVIVVPRAIAPEVAQYAQSAQACAATNAAAARNASAARSEAQRRYELALERM